jgi:ketosteroid isomerase-like protein
MLEQRRYGNPSGRTAEIEVVRAIYDAFARRDIDDALRHVHEDAEVVLPVTAEAAGRRTPYRGHAGVRQYFADVQRVWQELELYADDMRVSGQSVVVFGHVEGRVDGGQVCRRVIWTWKLREGKVASLRVSDVGDARRG